MLDVEVPLLHVGPDHLIGNRNEAEGERRGQFSSSDIRVTNDIALRRALQQGRGLSLHAFGVRLVSVAVLKEDAITTADRCFAVSPRVVGKADPRSGVEQVSLGATDRNAAHST